MPRASNTGAHRGAPGDEEEITRDERLEHQRPQARPRRDDLHGVNEPLSTLPTIAP